MRFLRLLFFVSLCAAGFAAPVSHELTPTLGAYTPERGFGYDLGTAPSATARGFLFSMRLPEGNYRVTVTFATAADAAATTIKAESRRLMVEAGASAAGTTRSFLVNTRTTALPPPPKNAPGGRAVILNEREDGSLTWDDKLTLEFLGRDGVPPKPASVTVEPAGGPTLFIVGDSTVCDQRWEDGASWGQMLPRFLPGIVIANHAESGETLKSFLTALRFAKVLSLVKPGDFMLIQFGHNDEKVNWPQTYVEAGTTFPAYLRVYLAEARRRGVTPILVTSMQRRMFDAAGHVRNSHGDYPAAVRALAAEEHVPLVDLERMSVTLYEALGPARSARLFANSGKDITHHNNLGAYELAKCVTVGLRTAEPKLAPYIAADFPGFDPAKPDDPDTFALAASLLHSDLRPLGN